MTRIDGLNEAIGIVSEYQGTCSQGGERHHAAGVLINLLRKRVVDAHDQPPYDEADDELVPAIGEKLSDTVRRLLPHICTAGKGDVVIDQLKEALAREMTTYREQAAAIRGLIGQPRDSIAFDGHALAGIARSWELDDPECQALALADAQVWATLHLAQIVELSPATQGTPFAPPTTSLMLVRVCDGVTVNPAALAAVERMTDGCALIVLHSGRRIETGELYDVVMGELSRAAKATQT